ncbi:thiosulfate sulfurtransferase [Sulfurifustis variabilis]|uniref:Thiosulfate sulfurtransferase n=1 Tax=Sulfurifustis variabilis TaxID=1675686 RepID=A0A1C7AFV6_9GAMM|nr:sulfurtransferase [Sulfurifustis variabilis]BAU50295.1 thiosulfate sulfurtransferase [Sulfurifustis variabilis]
MSRFIPKGLVAVLLAFVAAMAEAAPVLVDDAWVAARLDDPNVVLVDMSDPTQYLRFHLPGAVHLPYDAIVKKPPAARFPTRLSDAELAALLGNVGIARDRHVVLYDDMGGLNAARLFWELERIGHPKVSVLDGGLVTWVLNGRRVVNEPVTRAPTTYTLDGPGRDNEATLAEVRSAAEGHSPLLLDVRSDEEYAGSPREPRSGHVPGAKLWSWDRALDLPRGFARRPPAALQPTLESLGVKKDRPVITYCRSGHRAAQTYLTLRSLGYDKVKVYANSMNEYAAHADAPLKKGREP